MCGTFVPHLPRKVVKVAAVVDGVCLEPEAPRCIMLSPLRSRVLNHHEPQARSLRPRCDPSLPNPAQGVVASSSEGLERKQSRQSLGVAAGCAFFALFAIFPHCPR